MLTPLFAIRPSSLLISLLVLTPEEVILFALVVICVCKRLSVLVINERSAESVPLELLETILSVYAFKLLIALDVAMLVELPLSILSLSGKVRLL